MYVVVTILGVIFGSFINAFIWRLHLKSDPRLKQNSKYSILNGRSMCPRCKHILSPIDLVPIFSWLFLRGKCRYCHKPIDIQYPLVEIISGLLFLLSYIYWPLQFSPWSYLLFSLWLLLLILFISLSLYDFKYKILPNNLTYLSSVLALIYVSLYFVHYEHNFAYILSRVLGIIFSSGIFYLIYQISDGKWIGGGDVKLCVTLGLILGGPLETILMIFLASLIGSLLSLILLLVNKLKKNMTIAFGPLLIASTFICFFFGPQIINWYTTLVN